MSRYWQSVQPEQKVGEGYAPQQEQQAAMTKGLGLAQELNNDTSLGIQSIGNIFGVDSYDRQRHLALEGELGQYKQKAVDLFKQGRSDEALSTIMQARKRKAELLSPLGEATAIQNNYNGFQKNITEAQKLIDNKGYDESTAMTPAYAQVYQYLQKGGIGDMPGYWKQYQSRLGSKYIDPTDHFMKFGQEVTPDFVSEWKNISRGTDENGIPIIATKEGRSKIRSYERLTRLMGVEGSNNRELISSAHDQAFNTLFNEKINKDEKIDFKDLNEQAAIMAMNNLNSAIDSAGQAKTINERKSESGEKLDLPQWKIMQHDKEQNEGIPVSSVPMDLPKQVSENVSNIDNQISKLDDLKKRITLRSIDGFDKIKDVGLAVNISKLNADRPGLIKEDQSILRNIDTKLAQMGVPINTMKDPNQRIVLYQEFLKQGRDNSTKVSSAFYPEQENIRNVISKAYSGTNDQIGRLGLGTIYINGEPKSLDDAQDYFGSAASNAVRKAKGFIMGNSEYALSSLLNKGTLVGVTPEGRLQFKVMNPNKDNKSEVIETELPPTYAKPIALAGQLWDAHTKALTTGSEQVVKGSDDSPIFYVKPEYDANSKKIVANVYKTERDRNGNIVKDKNGNITEHKTELTPSMNMILQIGVSNWAKDISKTGKYKTNYNDITAEPNEESQSEQSNSENSNE